MTTLSMYLVIIIAAGFGLMFVVTFLQMMNINKLVRDLNDVLDCLWVTLGYLDAKDIEASQKKVIKKVKKSEESATVKRNK